MTVHKSQGSEFDRILFIVSDQESPLLSRELIYTGITRSRASLEIWYKERALRSAIEHRAERTSGLRDALWNAATENSLNSKS
jgi:exodeoxyribonuclease V alpha subunit